MPKSIDQTLTEHGFAMIDSGDYGTTYYLGGSDCAIYITALIDGAFEVVKQPDDSEVPATIMRYNKGDEALEAIVEKWNKR